MKRDWISNSMKLSSEPADFYSGCRKIIRSRDITFRRVRDDIIMADAGYTKSKMSMLVRNYLNEESHKVAQQLWQRRLEQKKYGSVGFNTYNHLIKGGGLRNPWEIANARKTGKPHRASVMGPCIQSVILTLLDKGDIHLDIFYRTTEFFKKFPADLVFINDVLLPPFKIDRVQSLTFHFANITCHPMYWVTLIPHLSSPIVELNTIKKNDKFFYDWIVKWTSRYVVPKYFRGIEKFSQAMRVRKDALERIDPKYLKKELIPYLMDNHPGYRNEYVAPGGDDEE